MTSTQFQTIIQGEASETDSEEELYLISSAPAAVLQTGTKVAGEASETDEEEEDCATAVHDIQQAIQRGLPPLIVIREEQSDILTAVEEKPAVKIRHQGRYSTLLQQKLRESNGRLHQNVEQAVKQMYESATKEIRIATSHLSNSQNGIINASHSIRLILDDLRSVTEKMDIITSCNLLPDIQIPPTATRPAQV
ncbi:biogenesis of lysosome-related organelles complex 1 subunit 3 [Stegostoma tigrinum]|uniref:biogenesis of lysosome-related organelles complex 1 subunit 3 n=1 Tax=Stegostoma tigrinum TaxID=3053191 RepID=UPI00286FD810|nr:biogenesis of lysosome-related organelles complex 1 subunit 3 [Stegostoma tigrinum]XP_048378451.2 biogenesis of lysosome-related organelles complex 1 subunit 3 [Stegostoma tigrinum]XP_048378452.2 biogenesis of lysosome-related organelles complex 1 subunit 3 [Stegostoma tigrinum]XP_048378453.2 biogenesis of lysosome-related organelles complex 1 subunit 3 [Stegostoma tigrinum]